MKLLIEKLKCFLLGHKSLIVQLGVGVQCLDCGKFWTDTEWFARGMQK